MSRRKLMDRVKRKADGPTQKINASESDRVARLVLDEVETKVELILFEMEDALMAASANAYKEVQKLLGRKREKLKS